MNKDWVNELPIDKIKNITAVSGGDVNDAYKIEAEAQDYFLLVQPKASQEFFETEAAGLKDLYEAGIRVPEVYAMGERNGDAYLLISYLEEGPTGNYRNLDQMIAKMHQMESPTGKFGYSHPHQGADTTFDNDWTDSWVELFIERRLDTLCKALVDSKKWKQRQAEIYKQARKIMVKELERQKSKPTFLHGDLWGGNHMFLTNGEPAIFDPAPFYGDREFDIGLSTGFGVYPRLFYEAYQEIFPMAKGYEKRFAFYRLYLFMVHLHKFGGVYESRVDQTLQEILNQY